MIHKLFLAWFALFFCRFDTDSSGGNTEQSSTTTNLDKRLVVDGGSVGISSDSSTVNMTSLDGGAIDRAFGFAKAGLDSALFGTGEALDFAGTGLDRAFNVMVKSMDIQAESEKNALAFAARAADNAMNFAFDAGKPDASLMQNYGKYLAMAGALIGVAFLWKVAK